MNILILSPFFRPNIGGVETHLDDLTKSLVNSNHSVNVITYTPLTTKIPNVLSHEKSLNLNIYRLRWIGRGLFLKFEPYFLLAFLYLFPMLFVYTFIFLLRNKVDVVHSHGLIATSISAFLSPIFRFRTVMSIHGTYNFRERIGLRAFSKLILLKIDRLLALSESSRKDFENTGVLSKKIGICTQWVDQDLFKPPKDPLEVRNRLDIDPEWFVILLVGRLIEKKGVRVLLEVAKKCKSNLKFFFVGTGPMEYLIHETSKKLSNVELKSKVSLNTLVDYYNSADIVVIPSQGHDEGFPRIVLESLSCGTPILAANRGCLPEAIDETVGIIVEPNVDKIYEKIIYLSKNKDKVKILRGNCRVYAEKRYSKSNVEIIINAYRGE